MDHSQTVSIKATSFRSSHMQCMSEVRWWNGELQQAWREVATDDNGVAVSSGIVWKRVPSVVEG